MSKYEEVAANQDIKEGDRITFTGPMEGEDMVRVVQSTKVTYDCGLVVQSLPGKIVRLSDLTNDMSLTLTKIERPIPEVELPSVSGYYESVLFPIEEGYSAYQRKDSGSWWQGGFQTTEDEMRSRVPLTRLVPETEVAAAKRLTGRIDIVLLLKRLSELHDETTKPWYDDAAALVKAIDNGELDK